MKLLGIVGGMSWESTIVYYRLINEAVRDRLGGLHSARLVLSSVEFQGYADDMAAGRWDEVERNLLSEADRLVASGVDGILIATNTMHMFAEAIAERSGLPVIHIADATGRAIVGAGAGHIGLLGTRYSMEKGFYKDRLAERFGIEALVPDESERLEINRIIFSELCEGRFLDSSKRRLLEIIKTLREKGIEGVVLGCTELPLILKPDDFDFPLWDTLGLHAFAAVDFMLKEEC